MYWQLLAGTCITHAVEYVSAASITDGFSVKSGMRREAVHMQPTMPTSAKPISKLLRRNNSNHMRFEWIRKLPKAAAAAVSALRHEERKQIARLLRDGLLGSLAHASPHLAEYVDSCGSCSSSSITSQPRGMRVDFAGVTMLSPLDRRPANPIAMQRVCVCAQQLFCLSFSSMHRIRAAIITTLHLPRSTCILNVTRLLGNKHTTTLRGPTHKKKTVLSSSHKLRMHTLSLPNDVHLFTHGSSNLNKNRPAAQRSHPFDGRPYRNRSDVRTFSPPSNRIHLCAHVTHDDDVIIGAAARGCWICRLPRGSSSRVRSESGSLLWASLSLGGRGPVVPRQSH